MNKLSLEEENDLALIAQIPTISSILQVLCNTTGMGFAAVARVTPEKWIACAVKDDIDFGLQAGGQLELRTTICHEISQHHQEVIIDHVSNDPQWSRHHTPKQYGLESYISFPIFRKDGRFFGTLCCIDPRPAAIHTAEISHMFRLFTDLIAFHIQAAEELSRSRSLLREEREIAELREQFIAILGHDLRNPVGAIRNVVQLLQRGKLEEKTVLRLVSILQNSTHRISGLIDNLMDFARARLGSGIPLERELVSLAPTLNHVVTELQLIWPDKVVMTDFALDTPIFCDSKRIAQLFSNILGNAISYSLGTEPIRITARSGMDSLEITVTNRGTPIPDDVAKSLFKPFSRGDSSKDQQGLGLGLFISAEIAKAHGGEITVSSSSTEVTFTFITKDIPPSAE